jgi:hypothetical protein
MFDPFLKNKLCLAPPVFEKVMSFGAAARGGGGVFGTAMDMSEEERAEARFASEVDGFGRGGTTSSRKFSVCRTASAEDIGNGGCGELSAGVPSLCASSAAAIDGRSLHTNSRPVHSGVARLAGEGFAPGMMSIRALATSTFDHPQLVFQYSIMRTTLVRRGLVPAVSAMSVRMVSKISVDTWANPRAAAASNRQRARPLPSYANCADKLQCYGGNLLGNFCRTKPSFVLQNQNCCWSSFESDS